MSDKTYEDFALINDNGCDITFCGYQLGYASSQSDRNNKRWTDLNLYVTQGGAYICEEVGRSTMEGEKDLRTVEAVNDLDAVINFFGDGWLAKRLYVSSQIKASVHVA